MVYVGFVADPPSLLFVSMIDGWPVSIVTLSALFAKSEFIEFLL